MKIIAKIVLLAFTAIMLCSFGGCRKKEEIVTFYEGNLVCISVADEKGNSPEYRNDAGENVYRLTVGQTYHVAITRSNSVGATIPFQLKDVNVYYSTEYLKLFAMPADENVDYCSAVYYSITPIKEVAGLSCVVTIGADSGNFSYEVVPDSFVDEITEAANDLINQDAESMGAFLMTADGEGMSEEII